MLCHWSHGPMTDMTGRQVGTWKATPLYLDIICKIDTPPPYTVHSRLQNVVDSDNAVQ